MPDKKDMMIRCKVLDYWIDNKIKKAYCIVQYIDLKEDDKHTNIFVLESEYKEK